MHALCKLTGCSFHLIIQQLQPICPILCRYQRHYSSTCTHIGSPLASFSVRAWTLSIKFNSNPLILLLQKTPYKMQDCINVYTILSHLIPVMLFEIKYYHDLQNTTTQCKFICFKFLKFHVHVSKCIVVLQGRYKHHQHKLKRMVLVTTTMQSCMYLQHITLQPHVCMWLFLETWGATCRDSYKEWAVSPEQKSSSNLGHCQGIKYTAFALVVYKFP